MRLTIPTKEQREIKKADALRKWHRKFAWKPTRMSNQTDVIVWLEFVLRKGTPRQWSPKILWQWEYVESTFDVLKMGK